MKLVFIGTGNSVPDPGRGMPCTALQLPDGVVLVDAGSGSIHSCIQYGMSIGDIKTVLLTHFHVDHVLDVAQLLWLRHVHEERTSVPLAITGPPGTGALVSALAASLGGSTYADPPSLVVNEVLPGQRFRHGTMTATAFKTMHTEESIGYRIAAGGRTVTCSGDSGPCDELEAACTRVDVAVLECTFDGSSPVSTHMGAVECSLVAARSLPEHLVLTHLPGGIDPDGITRNIKRSFGGRVTAARDFMEIDL